MNNLIKKVSKTLPEVIKWIGMIFEAIEEWIGIDEKYVFIIVIGIIIALAIPVTKRIKK